MAYMNDPRENRFGPNGEVWENDNRVEKRYRWNGAFVDLCDLPPEEYVKTIFHTDGTSSGGGVNPPQPPVPPTPPQPGQKTIVDIYVKMVIGITNYEYTAVAEKPVKTDVKIGIMEDNELIEFIIKANTTTGKGTGKVIVSKPAPQVRSIDCEPETFEDVEYRPHFEAIPLGEQCIRKMTVLKSQATPVFTVTGEDIMADPSGRIQMKDNEYIGLTYSIPVDKENRVYSLVLAVPEADFAGKSYTIEDITIPSTPKVITDKFKDTSVTYMEDGNKYSVLVYVNEVDRMFTGRTTGEVIIKYRIIFNR